MTDLKAQHELGFSEGKEAGLAEGMAEGKTEGRENMLKIFESLGVPKETLEKAQEIAAKEK